MNVNEELPRAKYSGELKFGNIVIPCAVLEDGRRLLTQQGFLQAIGRARSAKGGQGASVDKMPAFMAAKNLKPFVSDELVGSTKPILFRSQRGNKAFGYPAELLPRVCDVYLTAREAGVLQDKQYPIAAKCEVLVRGLATVGIIALVDEATGYQYDRNRDALNKILEAYIAKELLPWAKRFPDEFYRQLFRLRDWQYNPISVKRPVFVGKLTNQLVYEQLPDGVLDELKHKNPRDEKGRRKHKHHQFLTEDIGNPHLERHIASVTTLMRAAADWRGFLRLFNRAFQKPYQEEIFEVDEEN